MSASMQDTHPTVENELDTIFDKFNGEGAHACYCQRSVDGGCQCAIKDEYATEAKESIKALIASEVRRATPDGDWWVTSHDDDGKVTKVSGPYSTDSDAGKCRYELERREDHHNYWLERIASLKDTHTGEE